jgi:hypothetical protein
MRHTAFRLPMSVRAFASGLKEKCMSDATIGLMVLAIVFGGALAGMFLAAALPEPHLTNASKDTVRVGIGLVLTITALVLSLLIASAKSYFDAQNTELTDMSARVVVLDRVLAHYGPEAKDARDELRDATTRLLDRMWSKNRNLMEPSSAVSEGLYDQLQELSPRSDAQRSMQAQAASMALALAETRWLMYEQSEASVSKPLLVVMVFWLTVAFMSFGLFAPRNWTVVVGLFLCALAVSGAIFMILEMYSPFTGLIHISDVSVRSALAHLGQ